MCSHHGYAAAGEEVVSEMMQCIEDDRFESEMTYLGLNLMEYLHETKDSEEQLFITPHFYSHFDIKHLRSTQILNSLVNFQSMQLGFFFMSYGSNADQNRSKIIHDLVHTVKFECDVGSQRQNEYLGVPVKKIESGSEGGMRLRKRRMMKREIERT